MKRLVPLFYVALFGIGLTQANTVKYDTNSTLFTCSDLKLGCGTAVIQLGDANSGIIRISYQPTSTSVTVDTATPTTNANFGYLQIECLSRTCAFEYLPKDLILSIQLTQYLPDAVPTSFGIPGYRFIGGISDTSSAALVQWGPDGLISYTGSTAQVTYSLANLTLGLVSPASCDSDAVNGLVCGRTTIQGTITDPPIEGNTAIPEPAVSLLMATGLLALGPVRRRK